MNDDIDFKVQHLIPENTITKANLLELFKEQFKKSIKINHIDAIRSPIITEKATILSEQNKTVFKVHEKANKKNIKKNIEKLFKVNVVKINIINQKSKLKMKQGRKSYKSGYKKAIVTLKKGQSIDLTMGI